MALSLYFLHLDLLHIISDYRLSAEARVVQLHFVTTHHNQAHESTFLTVSVSSPISSPSPSVCICLSACPIYTFPLCLPTRCPWPQTSRRSSQGRTAPPSLSKALGVANHQFSVARRAVAVASPYCRRRPLAPSSRQPKSPRPRFPAQGKVRRDNQRCVRKQKKTVDEEWTVCYLCL